MLLKVIPILKDNLDVPANMLFALELDKRGQNEGVRAFSLHPDSIVGTGLENHLSHEELVAGGILDADEKPILDPIDRRNSFCN